MSRLFNKVKGELKYELIRYFELASFEIDIDAQKLMNAYIPMCSTFNDIVALNERMIKRLNDLLDSIMTKINAFEYEDDFESMSEVDIKEYLRKNVVNGHFYYVKCEKLGAILKNKNLYLGLLLITDWYLDENQLKYLSSKITNNKSNSNGLAYSLNSDVLGLYYALFKLHPYNRLIDLKDSILEINRKAIKKDLSTLDYLDLFVCTDNVEIDANTFQDFSHMSSLRVSIFHRLSEIKKNVFTGLSNLIALDLVETKIDTIQPESFRELVNLKELSLTLNSIWKADMFQGLENLHNLKIHADQVIQIEDKFFGHLSGLKLLRIEAGAMPILRRSMLKDLHDLEIFAIIIDISLPINFEKDALDDLINLKKFDFSFQNYPFLIGNLSLTNKSKQKIIAYSLKEAKEMI